MRNNTRFSACLLAYLLLFLYIVNARAIEIHFESPLIAGLDDAVLFTSHAGSCEYDTVAIGDIAADSTDIALELDLDESVDSAWLLARIGSDIVYTSSILNNNSDIYEHDPFDPSNTAFDWDVSDVINELKAYAAMSVKVKIGILTDTHYYRNPTGQLHPIEIKNPIAYDLQANLSKMQTAFDAFDNNRTDFAVILGDMVEDHAGWLEDGSYIANQALYSNLGDIKEVFDQYDYPIHLVLGNHDRGLGTTRTDLYNTLIYYAQENYDNNDYAIRMDYPFDVNGVRFVVYDNANAAPVIGRRQGYRWATDATLNYLSNELEKVSTGGVDEGMPVILMMHARIDCTPENNCNQKVDLIDHGKYQWTRSNGGVYEYYLEAFGGGMPDISHTNESYKQFVWLSGQPLEKSSVGSLNPDSWTYGNNAADGITFSTIYIRLAEPFDSSYDPDDAPVADYIQYKYINAGMSENFEEQRQVIDIAQSNGAHILAVLQGHHHSNEKNVINGIQYLTFRSPKTIPEAYAILHLLYDNSIYIEGHGGQFTYNYRKPYHEHHDCIDSQQQIHSELWDHLIKTHADHAVSADIQKISVWRFRRGRGSKPINKISLNLHSSATTYESAQDGSIRRWEIIDNDPAGAVISNVYDKSRQSRVIELQGASWSNNYALRSSDFSEWHNSEQHVLQWSMKYDETYMVKVKVRTNQGTRYLRYTAVDYDELGSGTTINFGLGSGTQDGQWRTYVRDLQQDLSLAQPGLDILEVNAVFIQGSGRIDDVKLYSAMPPPDTDGDGIPDDDENNIYFTDPLLIDTDGDSIGDGVELQYWSTQWDVDTDNDGAVHLLDTDSDNDGINDGAEIELGSNPSDPL